MQSDKKKKYVDLLFKNKALVIVLIVILIFLSAAVWLTSYILKSEAVDMEKFPESTLTKESDGAHQYIQSDILNNTMGCPSLDYDISLPGEIQENASNWLVSKHDEYYVTLFETEKDSLSVLNGRFSTYFMDTVDIPSSEWTDIISDTGYINGYYADYHTGILTADTKMQSYVYYGAMYMIYTEDGKKLALLVTCESLDELIQGKSILDSMIYSLVSYGDTNEAEENEELEEPTEKLNLESVDETEKLSETEDVYTLEDGQTVSTENGIEVFSKDFSLYVEESSEEELYIVFNWVNSYIQPIKMYVTGPDGKSYKRDKELSSDGEWVFIIPESKKGTYTIHGESTNTIYVNYYEAIDKVSYYASYKNINIENGEPVRGHSE